MPEDPTGHDVLARALGTAPDPQDAAAGEEARAVAALLGAVPVPAAELPGWQSLCAAEYADAVRVLVREIALAASALSVAALAVR